MKIGLIITAAGQGTRYHSSENKLFTEIEGKPLIQYTYDCLAEHDAISEIVLTVEASQKERLSHELLTHGKPTVIIPGGATRKESVQKGFEVMNQVDIVLVHDGARPYVTASLINRLIEKELDARHAAFWHGARRQTICGGASWKSCNGC